MRRSVYVKFKGIATAVAVLAIIAQPVYGFVAGQVAEALVNSKVTVTANGQGGWQFNRDASTSSPYSFTNTVHTAGAGSLSVAPIGTNPSDKFVAENTINTRVSDLKSIAYDFRVAGNGTTASANQFYLNVYATFTDSGAYYDCRFDYAPTVGSTTKFTEAAFATTDTPVNVRASAGAVCPPTLAGMATGSYVRAFAINVGDTTAGDAGLAGYLDNVKVKTAAGTTTSDFEAIVGPVKNVEDATTFPTIQSAINATTTGPGETLEVSDGAYIENVNVTKSLTVKGAQAGNDARTRAAGSESAVNGTFTVTAPNVTIDGFMFGSANAAVNFNAPGTKILNNIVTGSYAHGSFQTDHISTVANDVEISQNKFTGTGANIRFLGNKDDSKKASNVVVKDNTSDNAVSFLVINNTKNSTVTGNIVNAATGSAVAIQGGNDNLIIERNTIESSARTIYVTKEFIIGGVMYPKNSDIHVHFNNLLGGPSGATQVEGQTFKDNAQLPVDMTKNYWGSENGPYDNTADGISIPNVNPGQTDTNIGEITRNINYSSWLCQPFQDGLKIAVNGSCNEVPEVTLTTPVVNGLVSTSANGNRLNVTGTFMDDTAVNYLQLELVKDGNLVTVYTMHYSDAGLNSDGTFSVNIPVAENIPSGTYSLYYTGTDFTGGVTARMERTFVIDTVAPDAPTSLGWTTSAGVSIADNGTTAVYNGTASWQASTSGDTSQYIYKYWNDISTSQWKAGNKWEASPTSATSLGGVFNEGQGKHYFCVVAVDAAGNQSACSTPFGITYNTTVTPPTEPTDPEDEDTTQPGDNGSTNTGGNTPSPTNSSNSQSNQPSVSAPLALTNGFAFTNLGVATTPVANDDAAVLGTQTDDSDMSDTGVQGASVAKASTSAWNLMGLAWYWWILIAAIVAGFVWWMIAALRRRNQDA